MGNVGTRRLTALLGSVLVMVLVFLIPASALAFTDVPSGHQYSEAISDLSARGIINGFDGDTFGPAQSVTRQQFAKMIILTLDIPVSGSLASDFTDVQRIVGDLYPYSYVAAAADQGITNGVTPTLFKPYNNITRAQVISMVVRAADALHSGTLETPGADFTSSWGNFSAEHGANAAKAEANGLLDGLTSAGTTLASVDPFGYMPRGEVAQVLHNLLAALAGAGGPVDPPVTPPGGDPPVTPPEPPVTPPEPPVTPPEPPPVPPQPPNPVL